MSRLDPIDLLLLAAESIADVHALLRLATEVEHHARVVAADLDVIAGCSGATNAWREAGVQVISYHQVVNNIGRVGELLVCAPTGPVAADLVAAARFAGISCRVVQVDDRPDALPCSAAGVAGDEPSLAVSSPRTEPGWRPSGRWRGSGFPAARRR
jgi:hypothetical protein